MLFFDLFDFDLISLIIPRLEIFWEMSEKEFIFFFVEIGSCWLLILDLTVGFMVFRDTDAVNFLDFSFVDSSWWRSKTSLNRQSAIGAVSDCGEEGDEKPDEDEEEEKKPEDELPVESDLK